MKGGAKSPSVILSDAKNPCICLRPCFLVVIPLSKAERGDLLLPLLSTPWARHIPALVHVFAPQG